MPKPHPMPVRTGMMVDSLSAGRQGDSLRGPDSKVEQMNIILPILDNQLMTEVNMKKHNVAKL